MSAVDRIRETLEKAGAPYSATTGLDAALADERRATVERIRDAVEGIERLEALSPLVYAVRPNGSAISREKVLAILEAEGET